MTTFKPFASFKSFIHFILICSAVLYSQISFSNSSRGPAEGIQQPNKIEEVMREDARKPILNGSDILNSRFSNWGVDPNTNSSVNILNAWKKFEQQRDIVVAVVDTGIDPNQPFLADNLYVVGGEATSANYGVDFSKNFSNRGQPRDDHGHGTHVAGIIKAVFPNVKILALKYYNPSASGQDNLNSTIEALRYAVEQGVDIINYSGGGPEPSREELEVLKEAERKGILVVAAAGNEESNIDNRSHAYYPASYGLSNIITVAAHDQTLRMISSSNYGPTSVHLSAPGHRIKSSLPNDRAGYLTGTSQATAFVTGAAALLMSQFSNMSGAQAKSLIVQSAKRESTLLGRMQSGGRLDVSKAQEKAFEMLGNQSTRRDIANRTPNSTGEIVYLRSSQRVVDIQEVEIVAD